MRFWKSKPIQENKDQPNFDALVRERLKAVMDPDLHQDIVSLGFVKDISFQSGRLQLRINLTTPACPAKEELRSAAERALQGLPGVEQIVIHMSADTRGQVKDNLDSTYSRALGQVRNIITVASGKGGVGKSTSAAHIAYALAATGAKVGILDADIYGPSIPTMMKASHSPQSADSQFIQPAIHDKIKVMSVGLFPNTDHVNILRGPMAANLVKQFLTNVDWGELDYLLIDFPPGTGDIQLTIAQAIPMTGAVVVTTPQEVALVDVRKAVRFFEKLSVPVLGVLETMSYFVCDGCSKKHKIFSGTGAAGIAREFNIPMLGQIPMETAMAAASDSGQPLSFGKNSDSSSAMAYDAAAKELARQISIRHSQRQGLDSFELTWKN